MTVMFTHTDRWPVTSATGDIESELPLARPWGVRRMKPFKRTPLPEIGRMELDPDTQTTRYFDRAGRPIEMGKHSKTYSATEHGTTTGGDSVRPNHDQDHEQDAQESD
ncbi:putative ATP-grasp-modified RiPP [Carbonactinospora thermoautotrophica]|nr:putative ATP-grasp-modified RiPP [Carbonactinospora thermoautotrophica]